MSEEKTVLQQAIDEINKMVGVHKMTSVVALTRVENMLISLLEKEKEQFKKLQDFKDYVHKRLDDMGIEKDPESKHKEHGCRIGGRLDIVESLIKQ